MIVAANLHIRSSLLTEDNHFFACKNWITNALWPNHNRYQYDISLIVQAVSFFFHRLGRHRKGELKWCHAPSFPSRWLAFDHRFVCFTLFFSFHWDYNNRRNDLATTNKTKQKKTFTTCSVRKHVSFCPLIWGRFRKTPRSSSHAGEVWWMLNTVCYNRQHDYWSHIVSDGFYDKLFSVFQNVFFSFLCFTWTV